MAPEKAKFFIKGKIAKVHVHEKHPIPYRFRAVSEVLTAGGMLAINAPFVLKYPP
jgi:hypothetical protein